MLLFFKIFANSCLAVLLGARLGTFVRLVLNVLTILNSCLTFLFGCRRMHDLKNDLDKRIPKLDLTITETEKLRANCWWAGLKKQMDAYSGTSTEDTALLAEKTREEMKSLKAENDKILKQAKIERDEILKDAKATATSMIDDAKNKSKDEAQKIVDAARDSIRSEKAAAMAELKTHVAALSIEIAEKVVRTELSSDEKQKALANNLASDINMN